jgi:enterochelin esterase-like enzyme
METLLERAHQHGTPLIDGQQVTFLYAGETAPFLVADFSGWTPVALRQTTPGVWTYRLDLPSDAYVEYAYATSDDTRILDPLNPKKISNGIGGYNNFFDMPEATHTRLVRAKRGIPRGSVERHTLDLQRIAPKARRDVWLYHPPVDGPVPLVLVYDGRDYLRRAKLPTIVDNLIAEKCIPPVALAMVDNAQSARLLEYHGSEAALMLVTEMVLPLARRNLNLTKGGYAVMGASMGGLMALYTGLRLHTTFDKVISQSGAFGFDLATGEEAIIKVLVRQTPTLPLTIWQDVGTLEWLLPANRVMRRLLRIKRYDVAYREFNAGHNWTAWRDQLPDALATVLNSTSARRPA